MHKVPWNRDSGTEGYREAGGMEDLQTDVMRFMAILAFCLVAIFALVRSMPMVPEQLAQRHDAAARRPATTSSLRPVAQPPSVATQRPAPKRAARQTTAAPPKETQPTFTLRFASDAALQRLVRSRQVQLYALAKGSVWRLSPQASELLFVPAAAPARIHEMTEDTVPARLVRALTRAAAPDSGDVTWGVTLPGATTDAIASHLRSREGASLVIEADGHVRRERLSESRKGGEP